MKKDDLIARLTAAGVTIPEGATVAILTELAKASNVDLTETPGAETAPVEEEVEESQHPFDIEARKEIAAMTPAVAPKSITEAAIGEKTRLGLSRAQAIEILTNQAKHDAELDAQEKAKKGKA